MLLNTATLMEGGPMADSSPMQCRCQISIMRRDTASRFWSVPQRRVQEEGTEGSGRREKAVFPCSPRKVVLPASFLSLHSLLT